MYVGCSGIVSLATGGPVGKETCVRLLLDAGTPVDEPVRNGKTGLHLAAAKGHLALVKLLMEHGATSTLASKSGKTAVDLAHEAGNQDIVGLLARMGKIHARCSIAGMVGATEGATEGSTEGSTEDATEDATAATPVGSNSIVRADVKASCSSNDVASKSGGGGVHSLRHPSSHPSSGASGVGRGRGRGLNMLSMVGATLPQVTHLQLCW